MTDPDRVAQARALLAQLGVTLADLHTADRHSVEATRIEMPTVAEYLPRVVAAAGPGAARTYGNYWARMVALWGDRPLDTIAAPTSRRCTAKPSPRRYRAATAAADDTPANTSSPPEPSSSEPSPTDSSPPRRVRPIGSPSHDGYPTPAAP
ncbi:hypothetical protein Vau01_119200 [Virgisporangium aurantiacum]|uniref:Uncharacterized protein n=1 Tax=Virgisporangium aurantiacum TaxID=175570 RepID=A0A8J4E7K4_9ACTN|nr:hypothetical protein Vau01_119200 [Virgisporangium aurantiacum]